MSLPIALYLRKSSGSKTDNVSIERQKKLGIKYARENKLNHIIFQEVQSASREGRKEFNNLINTVIDKKIKGIWVWDLNRLDRRVTDFIRLRDEITELHREEKFSIYIHCNGMKYECWNADHRQLMGFNAIMNESVKDFIEKSTREAKISLLNKGQSVMGQVGYGYERIDKRIVIKESEAKWVREIYRIYLLKSIESFEDCFNHLTKIHPDYDFNISKYLVVKILTYERYIGKRIVKYMGEEYPIQMEGIIDTNTFHKVQDKIKQYKKTRVRRLENNYVLRNKVFCHKCDKEMWIIGGNQEYKYYTCSHNIIKNRLRRNNPKKYLEYIEENDCDSIRSNKITLQTLDKIVWDTLFDAMKQSKYIFNTLKKKYDDKSVKHKANKGKLSYWKSELKSNDERMKKALMKSVKMGFDLEDDLTEEYKKYKTHCLSRIVELEEVISQQDTIEDVSEIKEKLLNDLEIQYKDLSFSNMSDWINKYVSKVVVERLTKNIKNTDYNIEIHFNFGDEDLVRKFNLNKDTKNVVGKNWIQDSGLLEQQIYVSNSNLKFTIQLHLVINFPNNKHKIIYLNYSIL